MKWRAPRKIIKENISLDRYLMGDMVIDYDTMTRTVKPSHHRTRVEKLPLTAAYVYLIREGKAPIEFCHRPKEREIDLVSTYHGVAIVTTEKVVFKRGRLDGPVYGRFVVDEALSKENYPHIVMRAVYTE